MCVQRIPAFRLHVLHYTHVTVCSDASLGRSWTNHQYKWCTLASSAFFFGLPTSYNLFQANQPWLIRSCLCSGVFRYSSPSVNAQCTQGLYSYCLTNPLQSTLNGVYLSFRSGLRKSIPSSSSHGAPPGSPRRALSFPSRRMFLVPSVTRRMFGLRVVVTIFWENYFKVDRGPPVLCCCEELWWLPGSWGSWQLLL